MAELLAMGNDLLESYIKTATHAIIYSRGEEREKSLEQLRKGITHYCELEEKMKHLKQVAQRYLDTVIENEDDMKKILAEYCETTNDFEIDIASNKHMKHFNQQVTAIMGTVGGPVRNNMNETDDDLCVTQDEINVICPITKTRMTEPLRNIHCGHVYDKRSVTAMLGVTKKTKCPIVGCGNQRFLIMDDLQPDMVTQSVLDRMT